MICLAGRGEGKKMWTTVSNGEEVGFFRSFGAGR
jgi:hypothetical protein